MPFTKGILHLSSSTIRSTRIPKGIICFLSHRVKYCCLIQLSCSKIWQLTWIRKMQGFLRAFSKHTPVCRRDVILKILFKNAIVLCLVPDIKKRGWKVLPVAVASDPDRTNTECILCERPVSLPVYYLCVIKYHGLWYSCNYCNAMLSPWLTHSSLLLLWVMSSQSAAFLTGPTRLFLTHANHPILT